MISASGVIRTQSFVTSMIKTRVVNVQNIQNDLLEAVEILQRDEPVVMPTETVYGLAANALSSTAALSIFRVKNRPTDNPLIVHISSLDMLKDLVPITENGEPDVPKHLRVVIDRFWPGPLTILLRKGQKVPYEVTGGLETVAVRFPRHPVAKALIEQFGKPLAAPSANLSGRPSPTTAEHVLEDLDGRVEVVLNGGRSSYGLESTVLNALVDPPVILRPGSITLAMLKDYLPGVRHYQQGSGLEERPPTPGLKYRHYAPEHPVYLFYNHNATEIQINSWLKEGKRIVRLVNKKFDDDNRYPIITLSEAGSPTEIAHNLFDALRSADATHPDYIVCDSVPEDDEGLAIMNRLAKAASFTIY
jgi:L-threonylcarbamoyladenylate synthase